MLALEDLAEAADRLLQRHVLAGPVGEDLGHEERLREEALDLARPRDEHLVVFGQLIGAEDGNDVLQLLVALQHLLHPARHAIVLLADDVGGQESREGVEGIDRRVDTAFDDRTREAHRGAQVGKGCRDRGVGVVIGWHKHRLDRGDRSFLGGGDPLLEVSHLGGQGWLVPDGRRQPAEQGRDFAACQHVAEDVVDEEQDVLAELVAEILGQRQTGQPNPGTRTRRFVHLPKDQRGLVNDPRFVHLEPERIALARALADAGKNGEPAVLGGDIPDQLHDDDRLADAGATEQADLAALGEGGDEVDDLDPGFQHLGVRRLLTDRRGGTMDRQPDLGLDLALAVNRITDDVHHPAEGPLPHRDRDRSAGVFDLGAAHQPVGRVHRDRPDHVITAVLLHFEDKAALLAAVDLERVVDLRQILPLEDDVDDGTDDLVDAAGSRLLRLFLFLFRFLRDCHWCLLAGGQRFGAAHDFAQFFGDGRLPHLVAQQRQVLDQLACIIGRVAHRDHLGRVEACQIVQHRGVDLRLDVPR